VGERFRTAFADRPFRLADGTEILVTVSVGGAALPEHGATVADLMRVADRALYSAKGLGRNQVQIGRRPVASPISDLSQADGTLEFLQKLADDVERRFGLGEHATAVARWCGKVAEELGLAPERVFRATLAGRLHDVGKIAIPDSILRKPGRLADDEWSLVRRHAHEGARILRLVPGLSDVASAVADHHERPDGFGYPSGKSHDQIPLEALIVGVCSAWASMRESHPWREALTAREARTELRRNAGTQFDHEVVSVFLALEADDPDAFDLGSIVLPQEVVA
jgi:putative nucleotidyltransferase with HDIG domain